MNSASTSATEIPGKRTMHDTTTDVRSSAKATSSLAALHQQLRAHQLRRNELNRQVACPLTSGPLSSDHDADHSQTLEDIGDHILVLAHAAAGIPAATLEQLKAKAHFVSELINVEDGDIGERLAYSLADDLITILDRQRD
jgi:hypothetical protein